MFFLLNNLLNLIKFALLNNNKIFYNNKNEIFYNNNIKKVLV